jgi:hypothetical protein
MGIVTTIIVVVAITWVVWVLVAIRHQLRSGDIVVPPMFASTLLFGLGIVAVIALGASPLHLLWWFPLSVVLGVVVLMFPAGVTFTMACLGLLAGLKPRQDSSTKRR